MEEQLESYGTPSYCHEDIYKAYKLLITNVAGDLHADDVTTIMFMEDLPQDQTWKALQVLHFLEKRGRFSCYDIEPLETLLRESNRCDLITKYVTEYKRQYSTAAVQAYLQLSCTTSGPPHQTSRTKTKIQRLPVESRETGPTLPPATFDSVPEEATETQAHPQLQTANRPLSRTTSAPPHQNPMTSTKRRSLPVGGRETGPTLPPATFDSVPEEATETQPHPQLQTGTLSLSNTVLAAPLQSTSRHKTSGFQRPIQEAPDHDPEVFIPHSMENRTQHSLMSTHTPAALCSTREGERSPRTSTPASSLPTQFSQQLPHSRQLVRPTPYGASSHSITHTSSLSSSVHETSGQSSLGQDASSSHELLTSQVPHAGAAVHHVPHVTGVHSSSLNPRLVVEPSQAGHAFHQPSTLLHPQAYTSLPATSSEKIPSAAPMSLTTTRPDIQPPHTSGELTGELSSASYSGIQRPSALSLGSSSAHRTQPPADQSIEGHKPHAPANSKLTCRPFGKKKDAIEQEYLVNRKKLYSIICEHKEREYVRLKDRIVLNAECRANPELGLKIYPCGLDEDRDRFATIEADIYIKKKCPRLILESCVVSLMIQVIDCKTEQNLNADRPLTAECPLKGRSFRIYQAIDHQSILQSTSLMLKVRATAVLTFPPAPQAEKYELVQSPDKEFFEITWIGGERSS